MSWEPLYSHCKLATKTENGGFNHFNLGLQCTAGWGERGECNTSLAVSVYRVAAHSVQLDCLIRRSQTDTGFNNWTTTKFVWRLLTMYLLCYWLGRLADAAELSQCNISHSGGEQAVSGPGWDRQVSYTLPSAVFFECWKFNIYKSFVNFYSDLVCWQIFSEGHSLIRTRIISCFSNVLWCSSPWARLRATAPTRRWCGAGTGQAAATPATTSGGTCSTFFEETWSECF